MRGGSPNRFNKEDVVFFSSSLHKFNACVIHPMVHGRLHQSPRLRACVGQGGMCNIQLAASDCGFMASTQASGSCSLRALEGLAH